jgi:hypothetical protein
VDVDVEKVGFASEKVLRPAMANEAKTKIAGFQCMLPFFPLRRTEGALTLLKMVNERRRPFQHRAGRRS